MAILLDKAFVSLITSTLEGGEWRKAIRLMVDNGLSQEQVYELCNKINFYTNTRFDMYLLEVITAHKNKEAV